MLLLLLLLLLQLGRRHSLLHFLPLPSSPTCPLRKKKKTKKITMMMNSEWLKQLPRRTRDVRTPALSFQSRLFSPRKRETFARRALSSYGFVCRFDSVRRYVRRPHRPRLRPRARQRKLPRVKYSSSSLTSSYYYLSCC